MNRTKAIDTLQEFLSVYKARAELFAANRGRGPSKLRTWERRTNAYQADLERYYEGWSQDLADELAGEEDPEKQDAIIAAALAVLAVAMRKMGRANIVQGMQLGLGDAVPSPALLADISAMVEANDSYIGGNLIEDIRRRLQLGLQDPAVLATGGVALAGILAALNARVASYAGGMWTAIMRSVGEAANQGTDEGTHTGRVGWARDALAAHCADCLQFGEDGPPGRIYDSWDGMMATTGGRLPGQVKCSANCRCSIWVETAGGAWIRP